MLYESRSLIHGRFPAFACRKDVTEGFWSRVPYTWYGVTYGSIIFYFMFLWIYEVSRSGLWYRRRWFSSRRLTTFLLQNIGERGGPGEYFNVVGVVSHMFSTRTINWLAILFLPLAAIAFDVAGKVFGNMFYPTQTQIHIEIESRERAYRKSRNNTARENSRSPPRRSDTEGAIM